MEKKDDKHSNSDETTLFRDAVGSVKPVQSRRRHPDRPAPRPRARFARRDDMEVLQESLGTGPDPAVDETGDELLFQRPQVSRAVMRSLRRGRYAVQAEIDLHGMTATEAKVALRDFMAECAEAGWQCVRVVHGKGRGSGPRGPVLKTSVNRWLRRWEGVLAFCTALPRDGGTGAIYVLLHR